MIRHPRSKLACWVALAMALVSTTATVVWACSTPVFRYALERWPADPYETLILTHGPISAADRALVDRLTAAASAAPAPLNLSVKTIDVDALPESASEAAKLADPKLTTIVLYYPTHKDEKRVAFTGPLDAATVDSILDSPARREVGTRLMNNHSVVWVFLETGDAKADDAALAMLNTTLNKLQSDVASQPAASPEAGASEQAADLSKVQIKFSVLSIKPTDTSERFFKQILMKSEDELDSAKPIVFPIFGRGRALYAIAGRGINASNVSAAVSFLTGACSCEVKAQNPGVDLPMATNWQLPDDQLVVPGGGREPELTSIASLSAQSTDVAAPQVAPVVAATPPSAAPAGGTTWARIALIVVVGAVIAIAVSALLTRGGRGESS